MCESLKEGDGLATILAIDTSAKSVSCALVREGRVLGSFYTNTGMTHSQTLLPMVESLLKTTETNIGEVDAIAVNAGPGSFTGVRIGVSAVKGLAFTANLPCISVSTLASMAENVPIHPGVVICGVMDARCQQVYTALFTGDDNNLPVRISEDEAISISGLKERLQALDKAIVLVGDGSAMCYDLLKDSLPNLILAPASIRMQNAVGAALVAERLFMNEQTIPAAELLPTYLRLPQAERELNSRLGK